MPVSDIFNVTKQLTFYGAYHNNRVNVAIHLIFVPILIWTFQVMATHIPLPESFPNTHYQINDYLALQLNWPTIQTALYVLYYFTLEPVAAALYLPQAFLSLMSATAFAESNRDSLAIAGLVHGSSWIAQFLGHGLAEKRAPALLDNLLGAVVLAPFFVHLEILFALGYRPAFHREIKNGIGKEIAKFKKTEGDKARAAAGKKEL